jgi:hypothetical protein
MGPAQDMSFGVTPRRGPAEAVHTNTNMNPVIKAMCDKLCQADPYVTMMAGSHENFRGVVGS